MNLSNLKKQDWIITFSVLILAFLSVVLILSTTFNANNSIEGEGTLLKQVLFLIIGFFVYFIISSIDLSWLNQRNIVLAIYAFILLSLTYVLFSGNIIAQTQRWIPLGPFSFQPAEFAKLAIVIFTAYIFTHNIRDIKNNSKETSTQKDFLAKFSISLISLALYAFLIFRQPSLGNALILGIIWIIMIIMIIPIPLRYLLAVIFAFVAVLAFFKVSIFNDIVQAVYLDDTFWKIFVIGALLCIFFVLYKFYEINKIFLTIIFLTVLILSPTVDFVWNNLMLDYHKERIEIFLQGEDTDPLNSGYQVQQSIIAIGSGRVTGRGYLKGDQVNSKKLPYPYTDFIFAAWSEQFGFIGVIAIFSIYSILFYRILQVLQTTKDVFGKLIVIGVLAILVTNFLIHTAMNQGLIPVTGVPLPIISYGGSSILVFMIGLGLVQMVKLSTETQDLAQKFKWFNAKVG